MGWCADILSQACDEKKKAGKKEKKDKKEKNWLEMESALKVRVLLVVVLHVGVVVVNNTRSSNSLLFLGDC